VSLSIADDGTTPSRRDAASNPGGISAAAQKIGPNSTVARLLFSSAVIETRRSSSTLEGSVAVTLLAYGYGNRQNWRGDADAYLPFDTLTHRKPIPNPFQHPVATFESHLKARIAI
jgi:hypothetical protein